MTSVRVDTSWQKVADIDVHTTTSKASENRVRRRNHALMARPLFDQSFVVGEARREEVDRDSPCPRAYWKMARRSAYSVFGEADVVVRDGSETRGWRRSRIRPSTRSGQCTASQIAIGAVHDIGPEHCTVEPRGVHDRQRIRGQFLDRVAARG